MNGFTVWFTGLSGSGKTTLARMLEQELEDMGFHVEVLDGDEVRLRLSKGLGFSKEDRDENIRRISYVAKVVTRCGAVAITCAISPYREIRDEAREEIRRFVEVYVKCDLEECIKRDVKGLYQKALSGEIKNFTGVSDPYEEPLNPEIIVETHKEAKEESINKIISVLSKLGYLPKEKAKRILRG
jgi:adenylyl-sulfate kinase